MAKAFYLVEVDLPEGESVDDNTRIVADMVDEAFHFEPIEVVGVTGFESAEAAVEHLKEK